MSRSAWSWLVLLIAAVGSAQEPARPAPPLKLPTRELNRREALKLYALGLLSERDSRYLEAVRTFEEALSLDPEAAEVYRALIPLYLALERADDALSACGKALESDPNDYETWYLRARLCRDKGMLKESGEALARAVACPRLKEQPTQHYQMATQLGLLREENKDLDGAVTAYSDALAVLARPEPLLEQGAFTRADLEARAAELYERIGTLCLQARRFDQAVAAFAQAQAKNPDMAARLFYHLAKVRSAQDKPADALKDLNEYLKLQPAGTEAYELKVDLLERLQRPADILPELRRHAAADPHNVALQLLVAERCTKARQFPEAEQRYRKALDESPSTEAYRGLFALYKVQGPPRVREILPLLDQILAEATAKDRQEVSVANRARAMLEALRGDPELVKVLLPLAVRELGGRDKHTQTTWHYLATLAASNRQDDFAERFYRQCLAQPSTGAEAEIYAGLLQVLERRYKYEELVQICDKGLKDAKETNRFLFHRARALGLCRLGRYDDAIAAADQMVELATNEHRLQARLVHATLLSFAERHDKAIAECQELLKDASQPGPIRDIRYRLATLYTAAKRTEKAEEQLRLILHDDPDDDVANNDLGYHLADENRNLDEAEKLIRRAIELERAQRSKKGAPEDDHDHAAYIDSLGWALFRKGKLAEARQELERATLLPDGESAEIWDHLGDVCLRLKDLKSAEAAWEKAEHLYKLERRRKQDEQFQELQRKLKLLKKESSR